MATEGQSGPESLGEMFEGFFFKVPRYQRYYSWNKEQLKDLWTDLRTLPTDKDHYFGTIILQETPDSENEKPDRDFTDEQKKHLIIDGQQRITTISILFKAMLKELNTVVTEIATPGELGGRLDDIERTWLIDEDLYRLRLQKGDRDFFYNYVIEDEEHIEPDTPSEDKLKKAKTFFQQQFRKLRTEQSPEDFIRECDEIRQRISSLELMIHYVGAENNEKATRIFESENDRGKKLSMLERTKSFLMYMTYRSSEAGEGSFKRTINKVQSAFARIYEHMQEIEQAEKDTLSEDAIQRYHYITYFAWGSRNEYQGESMLDNLKTEIRSKHNTDRGECLDLIENYTQSLELAFKQIESILCYSEEDQIVDKLEKIYTLGNVARFYPLLINGWKRHEENPKEVVRLLDVIETAIIRLYAIGGHPSHAKRPSFHRIARDTSSETPVQEWRQKISTTVADFEDNDSFRRVLTSPDFYSDQQSKRIRYLLYFYEKHLGKLAGEPDVPSFDTVMGEDYEVEHIWPQTPEESPIDEDEYESLKHRLGNLTLVSDEYNKEELQNQLFNAKKQEFAKSSFRLNRDKITSHRGWGADAIKSREDSELVPFILDRWSLDL